MASRDMTRSKPSSATPRTAVTRVSVFPWAMPSPRARCRDRSPSGRRGDEVAVKAQRSVISAASTGVTMKRK
jgi:hypothetical protein